MSLLLKAGARFLGVDDGPHRRTDEKVRLVGVITQGAGYVEAVLSGSAAVDGNDGTRRVAMMVERSRFASHVSAVFLNGIFVGGFNLVDPVRLSERLGVPVLALLRTAPRPERVRAALRSAFEDPDRRWRRVEALSPRPLRGTGLWATVAGSTERDAARFVRAATLRGNLPEALRLAHVIASGIERGESRGPA